MFWKNFTARVRQQFSAKRVAASILIFGTAAAIIYCIPSMHNFEAHVTFKGCCVIVALIMGISLLVDFTAGLIKGMVTTNDVAVKTPMTMVYQELAMWGKIASAYFLAGRIAPSQVHCSSPAALLLLMVIIVAASCLDTYVTARIQNSKAPGSI